MVTFGMAITIPEEEVDLCRRLMRPAWIVAGLTNDLFSWQKEYEASRKNGHPHVVNAIWVLMQEHAITVEEAKAICKAKIKEHVAEYIQVVKDAQRNENLSVDLRRYLEATQYSLSGNVVWSLLCPRYHPEISNNNQSLWMKNDFSQMSAPSLNDDSSALLEDSSGERAFAKSIKLAVNLGAAPSAPIHEQENHHSPTDQRAIGVKIVDGIPNADSTTHRSDISAANCVNGSSADKPSSMAHEIWLENVKNLVAVQDIPNLGIEVRITYLLMSEYTYLKLSLQVVSAPFRYLDSLPSKGIRDQAIDALNIWVTISEHSLAVIKSVVNRLHGASLLFVAVRYVLGFKSVNMHIQTRRPRRLVATAARKAINAYHFRLSADYQLSKLSD